MRQKDVLFWIWLAEALGAANPDFRILMDHYENPYEIFCGEEFELDHIPNLSQKTRKGLADKQLSRASVILEACQKCHIDILTYGDKNYPNSLKELEKPPVVLYYKGALPDFSKRLAIGMVGTRSLSAYGLRSAYTISYELASVGTLIVSGMAKGIDGVCSAAAIAAGGQTVAVLGCGLDVVYPRHHEKLMKKIEKNGAVISEYPPGTRPNGYHFPIRNRLISGLTQGTVVVEAGLGSGALITAREAILQGKDLFAVPANLGSQGAEGTNELLREGANILVHSEDLLNVYQYVYAEALHMEVLPKAKKHSEADLRFLHSLGVIELTQRREMQETDLMPAAATEAPVEKKKPRTPAREPLPSKRSTVGSVSSMEPAEKAEPKKLPDSLTPIQLAVMQALPDDRAFTADALSGLDFPSNECIAALTILELMGLIRRLPGGMYIKS